MAICKGRMFIRSCSRINKEKHKTDANEVCLLFMCKTKSRAIICTFYLMTLNMRSYKGKRHGKSI
jgi:hypothetical protein